MTFSTIVETDRKIEEWSLFFRSDTQQKLFSKDFKAFVLFLASKVREATIEEIEKEVIGEPIKYERIKYGKNEMERLYNLAVHNVLVGKILLQNEQRAKLQEMKP